MLQGQFSSYHVTIHFFSRGKIIFLRTQKTKRKNEKETLKKSVKNSETGSFFDAEIRANLVESLYFWAFPVFSRFDYKEKKEELCCDFCIHFIDSFLLKKDERKRNGKNRSAFFGINGFYEVDLIKVLTGVRRCGKSILLSQIEDEFKEKGIADDHIIKVNFENIDFEKIRTCEKLNKYVLSKIKDGGRYYIFLDEIQHVRSFEKVLASFRATLNCSIFVTGSNSKLLSGKMATLLVGRCVEFRIMPFSFKEAYEYNIMLGRNITPEQSMTYIEKQYAVDTGFRMLNTNLVNFEDTFFLENIIYNELISRGYEVFTGKTYKGEVDFVVIDGRAKCFIQVASYLHGPQTIERVWSV